LNAAGKQADISDLLNNSVMNGDRSPRISFTSHVGAGSSSHVALYRGRVKIIMPPPIRGQCYNLPVCLSVRQSVPRFELKTVHLELWLL